MAKETAQAPVSTRDRVFKALTGNLGTYLIVIVFFVIIQAMIAGDSITSAFQGQLVPICVYVCAAVSLNLVVGVSGELSLGHAGFMSVGAFSGAILSSVLMDAVPNPALRLLLCIITGGIFGAIAGVIIGVPVMRLSGDYLAIVTLAFGEIIKNLLNNMYVGYDASGLHFSMTDTSSLGMSNGLVVLNGPQGAVGITKISNFIAGTLLVLFTLFVVLNLMKSRSGRAIMAVRDNKIAAEAVGINVTKYRLMAFVVAAALAGMAGALYALNFSSVVPSRFDYNTSILILVYVVLGGIGSMRGSVIAAAILTVLPEMLRFLADYRMLIYAIVLIAVMVLPNIPAVANLMEKIKEAMPWNKRKVAEEGGTQ